MEMQDLKDKPWKNEELKNSEEDMPRLKRVILKSGEELQGEDKSGLRWLSSQSAVDEMRHP